MATNILPPRLRLDGKDILKPNGKKIILKGFSFGAWGLADLGDIDEVKNLKATCLRYPLRVWGDYKSEDIDARDDRARSFLKKPNRERWLASIRAAGEKGIWT